MGTLQGEGMDYPPWTRFFWALAVPGSSHTGSPGESAMGQIDSGSLASLVSASPPGWEESGDTGRVKDMANLLKRGLAVKRLGAAHTDTLLPGPAPLLAQKKKSPFIPIHPQLKKGFFPPDNMYLFTSRGHGEHESSRWAMEFVLGLREPHLGLTGEWCSKSVLEVGQRELAEQAAFLHHIWWWLVCNPGKVGVLQGRQVSMESIEETKGKQAHFL